MVSMLSIDFAAPLRDLKDRNAREIANAIEKDKLNVWKNKAVKVGPPSPDNSIFFG